MGQRLRGQSYVNVIPQPFEGYFHRLTSELLQETQIVGVEDANILDPVAEHGDAFDAHTEGEARVPFGIVADLSQDLRMDHTAAQDLQPAGVSAGTAALA